MMRFSPTIKILLPGGNLWYFGEGMLGPLFAIFTANRRRHSRYLLGMGHFPDHDSYARGFAGGQSQIVTGPAIIAGGMIVNYFSFEIPFITMGCIQIMATLIQARLLKMI